MNHTFRNFFYDFFYYTGIAKNRLDSQQKKNKVILTYHNVLPKEEIGPYFTNYVDVQKDVFEFQIKNLIKNFKVQSAVNITNPLSTGIFLCFDDGMSNNFETVYPILTFYGITAMFAVCTGFLNGDMKFIWRDRIFLLLKGLVNKRLFFPDLPAINGWEINASNINTAAFAITVFIQVNHKMDTVYQYLKDIEEKNNCLIENNITSSPSRYIPMDLEQIKTLSTAGNLIVSHTHTHRKLSKLSGDQVLFELKTSKDYLSQNMGNCNTIVYPYGTEDDVNSKIRAMAKNTGYEHAFMNNKNHSKDELCIPRINMGNLKSTAEFFGISAGLNKILK